MMPIKDPTESVVVEFDFDGEMESVTSAVVTATVHSGTDANPSGILYAAPQVSGDKVTQRIQAGVSGVTYTLRCEATAGLDVVVRSDLLPVKTRAQTT